MKKHSTKKALVASVLALAMCFTMLVGTTFAWFTDSVSSTGNVIKSGKLEIAFEKWDGTNWVNAENTPIFNYEKWEPGYTQIVNLRVVNKGTLALKWQAIISTEKSLSILADVINVYVRSDDQADTVKDYIDTVDRYDFAAKAAEGQFKKFTLRQFINDLTVMTNGKMVAGQESYLGIVLQMDPLADNKYQNLDLGGKFDLTILATQWDYENDSLGTDYDVEAPFVGSTVAPITGASAEEIHVYRADGQKLGSFVIPADAIADGATETTINITDSDYAPNITVATGYETQTFDVTVTNLKADNTAPIKVQLRLPQNLDPATVAVYHYDQLVFSTYNPDSGLVTFNTTSFSPFTLVYDEQSEYEPPVIGDNDVPTAVVNLKPEFVGVSLPWGSYGQWSPNTDVDTDPKLEAAYVFTAPHSAEEAKNSVYANWECDFFVKLDRDLGANQIFLGGNYGSFGWVGFHNGDVTPKANQEIALLGSVTKNAWTYLDVAANVGSFICGVGDVNNALDGATFTVTLRLTNPQTGEKIDVNTVSYTFGNNNTTIDGTTIVTTGQGIQDAINNGGSSNIQLGGDIDLSDLFN